MNLKTRRKISETMLKTFIYICVGLVVALLVCLIGYIMVKGIPYLTWELLSTSPRHSTGSIGILPNIINTLYIVGLTLLISLPLGVGAAIYLTEYAKNYKFIRAVEFATEILAGIPSIIYGLVGMLFFVRMCGFKVSLLSGALTMTVVVLPTIIRTTQESLKSVPQSYREGALGLGSGKWHMIKTVVLPSSLEGIVTGCILAIGRIVGESAALLFTAGMGTAIASNIFSALNSGGGTLSVALYMYAMERAEFDIAFAIAALLLILVFIINMGTKAVKNIVDRKQSQ